ncbi:HutD family protein [Streptomyces sp. NBC_01565]|uniref:HutD/Ves family protein n=1 Tax=unclassified Streptomyces TaxID=2593676 RepID=UPI00225281B0|nr:HutD family protein [Streptomyces sp. NBC_01565]MCX4539586.1 HutD family protein [Streptomyces sp. NBC_01565]
MTSGNEVRVRRAADRAATAWKNGGGVTREIAARPEGAGTGDFEWRVSLADVAADGPFSAFPGIDRTLTLAEGAGMDLTVAGAHRLVDERYAPRHFAGDAPTDCRLLGGPVVNFNVMYRRATTVSETAVVRGETALAAAEPGETLLVVALDGTALLEAATAGRAVELALHDAALLPTGLACRVRTEGHAAVVRFRPRADRAGLAGPAARA